jgi:hypothetical protein
MTDFFDQSLKFFSYNGLNFSETKENLMGIGIRANLNLKIAKNIYLSPSFSVYSGHQHYEYKSIGNGNGESVLDDSFFYIFSGEFNLIYDALKFKNGWVVFALAGGTYNSLKADPEIRLDDMNEVGYQVGMGLKFRQLNHLGFQVSCIYKVPFPSENIAFGSLDAGVYYEF